MPRYHCIRAFSLLELLCVLAVLMMVMSLFVPALSGARRSSWQMTSNTQLRGIHQSMIMYAQGNGGWFPGLDRGGADADLAVERRFEILLQGNYFTGDYAISPAESSRTAWTTGTVTTANYSYAMLQVPAQGGRRVEWRETLNTEAIAGSDRDTGTVQAPQSVHSGRPTGGHGWGCRAARAAHHWVGAVVYNDNHVVFETTSILRTTYGERTASWNRPIFDVPNPPQVANPQDDLFVAEGDHDAMMVHSGN